VSELGRLPAELELARGRLSEATERIRDAVARMHAIDATPDAENQGELLAWGATVEAEVAIAARARRDALALDVAFERASGYVREMRALHGTFMRAQPSRAHVSAAFLRAAEAELARLAREPAD